MVLPYEIPIEADSSLSAGLPAAEWVLLRGYVPRRTAEEARARLDFLSDAAVG